MAKIDTKVVLLGLCICAASISATGCMSDAGQPAVGQSVPKPAGQPAPVTMNQVKIMGSGPPPGAPGSAGYDPNASGSGAVQNGMNIAHQNDAAARAKALGKTQ